MEEQRIYHLKNYTKHLEWLFGLHQCWKLVMEDHHHFLVLIFSLDISGSERSRLFTVYHTISIFGPFYSIEIPNILMPDYINKGGDVLLGKRYVFKVVYLF